MLTSPGLLRSPIATQGRSHRDRVRLSIGCTFFAQSALPVRTEIVHVFHAGDWPIPTDLHNPLFSGALPELARFLQRLVRAMH
ncbi:hypothetical protein [Pseudomonas kurunegalensis]|uniref:hypothetical protein n=1 Tax=Pseudomonas kurunegalensis TaxID=485880 RepID=UPI00236492F8|nr:hypothetical protein [Pseudomonas kurunegalensis]MDD2132701.1 hypothetical protein [Pseudomonas kurunegalensis]